MHFLQLPFSTAVIIFCPCLILHSLKLHENVADEKHKYPLKLIWGKRKHSMDPIWRCFLLRNIILNMILTSVSLMYFLLLFNLLQEIKKKQKRGYAFKFQIRLKAFLEKFSFENNKLIKIEAWFPSNTYTVLDSIHIRKKINTAIRDIYKRYDSFVQRGSGWVLKKVSKFSVSIMKFKLFQGGCLSALLPRELCKKRCCVSIKNIPKNKCFFILGCSCFV